MRFRDLIPEAFASLRRNQLRSLLTMLGVIIGIFTVLLTLGIGAGARTAIEQQIAALGSNLVVLNSGPPPGSGQQAVYLYSDDADAIIHECPAVATVAPQQETRLALTSGSAELQDNFVMGITASYAKIRHPGIEAGRFIEENDDETDAKVAVLGSAVANFLFGGTDPVDQRVRINSVDFEVVGTLEARGDSPGLGPGMSTDDRVFIPLSALQKRLFGGRDLRLIAISAISQDAIPEAADQVRRLMNERHPRNPFEIRTQGELLATSNSVSGIVTLLLTCLAAVSLIVGGIGIMNIMLVAVTERTREIGIRRAVGARRSAILGQFLFEALALTFAGGLAGILAGMIASRVVGAVLNWNIPVLPQAIAAALIASMFIGIASGLYPARQASKVNVVEALHSE
jgi:putative ABC transport system permease protein